jgi:hypothetical protein
MRSFFVVLLLFSGLTLYGRTYYLSPDGSDSNPGTISGPFFSLNKVWTVIFAGDTVYLRGGTYQFNSTQYLINKKGTSVNHIKIWAYPGETPVITRSSASGFKDVWQSGICFTGDYFHWKGIEITGFTQLDNRVYTGFRISDSNNNIIERINSHHNGHGCVISGKSTGNLVLNSDFHNNQDPLTVPKYEDADGLEICYIPAGMTNSIKGCRFWWNSDDGLDLWENDGTVVIDSCWSWNNGFVPGTNVPAGNGNGFKLGVTTINHGSKVLRTLSNCLTYNNRARGFDQNKALCSMVLYNTTAYMNGTSGFVFDYGGILAVVKNSISYKNAIAPSLNAYAITAGNSFRDNEYMVSPSSISDQDFLTLDGIQLELPRNDNGGLPDIQFMHLASGSALVDGGVDVGLPYGGKAPDIGAFEIFDGQVNQNKLPVVSISFPVKGTSFVPPATVSVSVEAYDPDGTISKVELYNGSKKLAETAVAPYSFTLKDLPAGSYNIVAIATDDLKAIAISATLELSVLTQNQRSNQFNLYPNPNNGRFTVDLPALTETDSYMLTIVDLIGNTVYREEVSSEESTIPFDLTDLKSGIYVMMIASGQILLTQKLIKN